MPEKTPADRGRRLIDALIIWITPSPPSPASTVSRSESPEAGDTWLEPSAVVKIAPTDRRVDAQGTLRPPTTVSHPASSPANRSGMRADATGGGPSPTILSNRLRAIPLRALRYRSGRAPRRTSMCTDRGQRAAPRRRGCLRPNRRRRAAARTRWRGQPWRRSPARPSSSRLGASLSVGTVICSAGWWSGQGKQPPVVLSKRGVQLGRPQRAAAGVLRLEGTITYRAATGSQKQFATSTVDTTTHFGRVQGRRP